MMTTKKPPPTESKIPMRAQRSSRTLAGLHLATWLVSGFVLWGAWNAQTDRFPLNEHQARPSWYVYGWPICFATSGRGRFNIDRVDIAGITFDLALSLAMIACTIVAAETLLRRLPRLTVRCMLSIIGGVAFMSAVWSGRMHWFPIFFLGASLPYPNTSADVGDVHGASELFLVIVPLSFGLFSIGFVAIELLFKLLHGNKDDQNSLRPTC